MFFKKNKTQKRPLSFVGFFLCLLFAFPFVCFAQNGPAGSSSDKKTQELTLILAKYQEDVQKAEKRREELLKAEDSLEESSSVEEPSSENFLQGISALLDNQEMPVMQQAFDFLLLCSSPEFWGDKVTVEQTARFYLEIIKHSNSVIRLYGLSAINEFKKLIKNPQEGQSGEDVSKLKKIISIVEAGYSPSTQDQKLLEQYEKCYAYLEPILMLEGDKALDTPGLMAVFEKADPAVQFYFVFKASWAAMGSENEKVNQLLTLLGEKGDFYVKSFVALSIMDEEQINKLLRSSTNPDELLTLVEFLRSRNIFLTLDSWPDKAGLEALLSKASPGKRGEILILMKETIGN